MAATEEKEPYVNPYQELADKAVANREAMAQEYTDRAKQQSMSQQMGYQMNRGKQWEALLNALMQKRKKGNPLAATQIPGLDMGSWGGR